MVSVPIGRRLCYSHQRRRDILDAQAERFEHVLHHLRESDRVYLQYLVMPLTIAQIAEQLGPGYTSRMVETAWLHICSAMGSEARAISRLQLLRTVACLEPCFCQAVDTNPYPGVTG
jgi:hypothetical protein